eukprot:scaffold486556_cov15-Prasinocladus_malaysianus.AAC.1
MKCCRFPVIFIYVGSVANVGVSVGRVYVSLLRPPVIWTSTMPDSLAANGEAAGMTGSQVDSVNVDFALNSEARLVLAI